MLQDIDWSTYDFESARDQMFDTKDKWIAYKRQENEVKKVQHKLLKLHELNVTF